MEVLFFKEKTFENIICKMDDILQTAFSNTFSWTKIMTSHLLTELQSISYIHFIFLWVHGLVWLHKYRSGLKPSIWVRFISHLLSTIWFKVFRAKIIVNVNLFDVAKCSLSLGVVVCSLSELETMLCPPNQSMNVAGVHDADRLGPDHYPLTKAGAGLVWPVFRLVRHVWDWRLSRLGHEP